MLNSRYQTEQARGGVTLLEVIFSTGVIIVGLIGVASLLPVAADQAGKGLAAERLAVVGNNARHDFSVRGYRSPERFWRRWDRANSRIDDLPTRWTDGLVRPINGATFTNSDEPGYSEAYCIDPQFFAQHYTPPSGTGSASLTTNADLFPYYAPTVNHPRMNRITVTPVATSTLVSLVDRNQAARIFRAEDDLSFSLPTDDTLPAEQSYFQDAMRQADGQFSWMATLAPKLDLVSFRDPRYTLSIVVFQNRDSGFPINPNGTANRSVPATERVVDVAFLSETEAVLIAPTGRSLELATLDLSLNDVSWVMLSDVFNTTNASISGGWNTSIFRWYEIVASDDAPYMDSQHPIVALQNRWLRNISLRGPAWPNTNKTVAPWTQATLVEGVKGVYETTIELEASASWR